MSFVDIRALDVRYGDTRVVHDLSLTIGEGEFLALLGPSGCGKTTILRAISGLLRPAGGSIHIAGEDVTQLPVHERNLGYVFQNYALFPHFTVAENVAFGLRMRRIGTPEVTRRVREALELVRLTAYADRRPRQLSGGQQQRVALARALVISPRLLLLDECLSNLDAKLREELRDEIRDIQRRLGITTLFVTHDQTEALTMCDRVAVLDQGRLAQVGTPRDVYERPRTPFVARFVGRINEVAAGMVRPHRVAVSAAGTAATTDKRQLHGVVTRKTFVGNIVQLTARTPEGLILAETSAAGSEWDAFEPGDEVTMSWAAEHTLVFRDDGSAG
jgi:putative spermidine/putrescine transport system ATP-binding protein